MVVQIPALIAVTAHCLVTSQPEIQGVAPWIVGSANLVFVVMSLMALRQHVKEFVFVATIHLFGLFLVEKSVSVSDYHHETVSDGCIPEETKHNWY